MKIDPKKAGIAAALVIALLLVLKVVAARFQPSPEAQQFNEAAERIKERTEQLK